MDKNTLLNISYIVIPLLAGFLGYYIKARQEVSQKRLEWKEKKYSELIYFMAQFYYRPASIQDKTLRVEYAKLEDTGPSVGRAYLQNIMHAKIDELWLYAPDDVIKAAQYVEEILDKDPAERVSAVGKLVVAMRKDISGQSSIHDWNPQYSEPKEKRK